MQSSKRKVVYITGITGIVGRVLADGLKAEYTLRGSSRRGGEGGGVAVAKGDITDPSFLREAFRGVDIVIHLAGHPNADAGWDDVKNPNIEGVYQMFEAARHPIRFPKAKRRFRITSREGVGCA